MCLCTCEWSEGRRYRWCCHSSRSARRWVPDRRTPAPAAPPRWWRGSPTGSGAPRPGGLRAETGPWRVHDTHTHTHRSDIITQTHAHKHTHTHDMIRSYIMRRYWATSTEHHYFIEPASQAATATRPHVRVTVKMAFIYTLWLISFAAVSPTNFSDMWHWAPVHLKVPGRQTTINYNGYRDISCSWECKAS